MGISKAASRAFQIIGAALVVTLANSASTLASPAADPTPVPAVALAQAPRLVAPKLDLARSSREAPKQLRRLEASEVTSAIARKARRIINANYTKPFGTEIPFEIDGTHYVGRIERHYHPPGGKLHPWGYHHGCSVFMVVDSSS